MVAHRLSTVQRADLVCVVDQSELVEVGAHDELIAIGGIFARLHETQFASAINGLGTQAGVNGTLKADAV